MDQISKQETFKKPFNENILKCIKFSFINYQHLIPKIQIILE